ncbi:MAG: HD domain-containing protein [Firmicutes bacterium]|nr:HD domain-containing protein [Bacillota bacterium]MCM1401499.1 HD domain-containing protein [Bacteroides sp.]MCM1477349.1 HD domain-containing protein [Bacteroides sp.]
MQSEKDYSRIIDERAERVFKIMAERTTEQELQKIKQAFELARQAHANQKRKTGEPYILHPIAVANIAAEELMLDANSVMAAFLHDVVEDTDYTIEDIAERFGSDVAFLVKVVTKRKTDKYKSTKQVDNFRQMLDSFQYDIRAMLIKLADRLHNMRTLSSMRPDKQMKIAGETDYFYAPLANRLGLYHVKTELENLSFRFRCPHEYEELHTLIRKDEEMQRERLARFCHQIKTTLLAEGIKTEVRVEYRAPYSVWRKMAKFGDDFNHLKYRHFTDVIFSMPGATAAQEKDMVLKIYSILTTHFKEKPGGITNYIDSPKENGYQSFHVKLLADFGRWQEVHISSERMIRDSKLGCVADRTEDNIQRWIEKFRGVLRDVVHQPNPGTEFIDKIVTTFYNDDIMTFTPTGKPVVLPQKATVLDFAYEISDDLGRHARYARINNFLASVKARLHRGDVVEVFTDPKAQPREDWLESCVTYKARKAIKDFLDSRPRRDFLRCHCCNPIPGEEVVGFIDTNTNTVTVHKRDCPKAIRLASQWGDNIVSVDYAPDSTLYPETIVVTAVDRFHLFIDLVDCITNQLGLSMDSFNTDTHDSIVTCTISLGVHSFTELQSIMHHIAAIPGVDTVKRAPHAS